ncbi:MAG: FMN-binding protein [Candidatus Omnitrophota bacterium]
MKTISLILGSVVFLSLLALAESSSQIEGAIKNIFPTFQEYKVESLFLDNQEVKVCTVIREAKILGWTVILDEMGKIKPITFLVAIDIEGNILAVNVLEYRDMFGSEIKRRSFLRQFQGKSLKDSIVVGRDIDAVTGASISSHAAASAVKKSLTIIERIQKDLP